VSSACTVTNWLGALGRGPGQPLTGLHRLVGRPVEPREEPLEQACDRP
jgi:hypothetical protein